MYPIPQKYIKRGNDKRGKTRQFKMSVSMELMQTVLLRNKCILLEISPNIFLNYLLTLKEKNYELFVSYIEFVNSLLLSKVLNDYSLSSCKYFQKLYFSKNYIFFQIIMKQHVIYQKFQNYENFNQLLNMQRHLFGIERTPVCSQPLKTIISTRNLHYPKFIVSIIPMYQSFSINFAST